MKTITKISRYMSLLVIVLGVPILLTSKSPMPEMPLLVGLFILFISSEDREDERSTAIRSTSAFIALVLGYVMKLVITNLYDHQIIGFNLTSINYFLIIVFALANVIRFFKLYYPRA